MDQERRRFIDWLTRLRPPKGPTPEEIVRRIFEQMRRERAERPSPNALQSGGDEG